MPAERTILHCDLNGFFASVEALEHPEIGDRPMAVSGNPRNRHGVILAKNEAAKKFGISTGEAIIFAKKKCPDLILLEAHHEKYEYYSRKVNAIYARFTNMVEPFGIDESWLDVTASEKLFGNGAAIADKLRRIVKEELNLTISVGVSFNKIFAKLASDYKKPDATTIFGRQQYDSIIRKLPAKTLLFVGPSTADSLSEMGIQTIGELADADDAAIERRFGKAGISLLSYARGEDDSPVSFYGQQEDAKSVGNSITFKRDLLGESDVKMGFRKIAEKVSRRLKQENLKCLSVQITIKGADFSVITRQTSIPTPINSIRELEKTAFKLLKKFWNFQKPIRMLGISANSLQCGGTLQQAELFAEESAKEAERESVAEDAFFDIRKKFGKDSIKFGNLIDEDIF